MNLKLGYRYLTKFQSRWQVSHVQFEIKIIYYIEEDLRIHEIFFCTCWDLANIANTFFPIGGLKKGIFRICVKELRGNHT